MRKESTVSLYDECGMCCITLDAKVVLNNFFGSPKFSDEIKGGFVNRETIDQCCIFISNNLPGYVMCDLSDEAIFEAMKDGNFDYDFREKNFRFKYNVDREIYNQYYPQKIANELEHIVDCFLERRLYKEHVMPIKTLIG